MHGEFRATADIDFVAQIPALALPTLMQEWDAEFVAVVDQAQAALEHGTSSNVIHRTTYLKVDFFAVPHPLIFRRSLAR